MGFDLRFLQSGTEYNLSTPEYAGRPAAGTETATAKQHPGFLRSNSLSAVLTLTINQASRRSANSHVIADEVNDNLAGRFDGFVSVHVWQPHSAHVYMTCISGSMSSEASLGPPRWVAGLGGIVVVGCWLRSGPSLSSDDRGVTARLGAGEHRLGRPGWRSWLRW
jgi:hypothetical protein